MAFTGKPTYVAFSVEVQRDVSPVVAAIAPLATPWLDFIGDSAGPANVAVGSTEHRWLEDEWTPQFTMTVSTAINSATADTGFQVDGWGGNVQPGDILTLGTIETTQEHMVVLSSAGAESILVSRQFAGTTGYSTAAGGVLGFMSNAKLEGEVRQDDISRARVNKTSFVQYMAKPIEVSGSMEAVLKEGGIGSEFDYQSGGRVGEILRDLEKQSLMGVSVETIGDGTNRRTIKGVWAWATNTHTAATITQSFVDNAILTGSESFGGDFNYIVCGGVVKLGFDRLPGVNLVQTRDEKAVGTEVTVYHSGLTEEPLRIIRTRQMAPRGFIIGHSDNVAVLPLRNRSFQLMEYAKTKDARQGEVIGEYTAEPKLASQLVRGYITG